MMKDLNQVNPRTANDHKWREDIVWHKMLKKNTWYAVRLVGGVFSFAQHWIEFTTKDGEKKRFPLECRNWNQETESADLQNDCPACDAGIKRSTRYLINVIDREVQKSMRPGSSPIAALDLTPTTLREIIALDNLNIHNGQKMSIAHPVYGCDIHLQYNTQGSKPVYMVQKGDTRPITEEESNFDLFDFDTVYRLPDADSVRENLKRLHVINPQATVINNAPLSQLLGAVSDAHMAVTVPDTSVVRIPEISTVSTDVPSFSAPSQTVTPPTTNFSTPTQIAVNPPAINIEKPTTAEKECFADGVNGKKYKGKLSCTQCNLNAACKTNSNR